MKNEMTLAFDSISENEAFARVAVSAFITQLNPTLEVRTVIVRARLTDQLLELWVSDEGTGIANIQKAMEPLYTTRPELERSGMGFMFMEAFMDQIHVESAPGVGTTVYMKKQIGHQDT